MTLGDIIEKLLGLFGVEPGKTRKLRERVTAIMVKIKEMEDGLREMRKRNTAQEEKIADLKRELKVTTGEHNQDLIMDEIEREEKEFDRTRELANLKGLNVDAARTLRSKLEQLLETAVNGGNPAELEDVLDKVENMDADMSEIRNLVDRLEKPSKAARAEKPAAKSKTADADRAARRARILGEAAPAPAAKPAAEAKKDVEPEARTAPAAALAEPASAQPGVAAVR